VIVLGAAVLRDIGVWSWLLPVALMLGIAIWILRRRLARRRA